MSEVIHTDTQESVVAIEVSSLEVWETICALQPHFKELDAEENIGNFVIVSAENPKFLGAIISPNAIGVGDNQPFDHLTPNQRKLKFVNIVR